MRQHHRPSPIRHLLPDHHVYVRSGSSSRYVVLAWPWQIGTGLVLAGLILWAGLASYGWVAAQIETRKQGRELDRLAQINQRLEAMAEAMSATEQAGTTPVAVARLVVDLEEIKAGQRLALRLAEVTAAEAEEPMLAPADVDADVAARDRGNRAIEDGLAARLLPAALRVDDNRRGRDWLYDRLTRHFVDGPAGTAEMVRLRAELRAARAEIARLKIAPGEAGEAAR